MEDKYGAVEKNGSNWDTSDEDYKRIREITDDMAKSDAKKEIYRRRKYTKDQMDVIDKAIANKRNQKLTLKELAIRFNNKHPQFPPLTRRYISFRKHYLVRSGRIEK